MNKIDTFRLGVENLKKLYSDSEKAAEYMSDPNNWVLVHATQYMPRQNESGQRYIPTTAMVRDFDVPRSTVHFTLNHVVHSHMMGNWDGKEIVVLTPYNDAVKQNQKPAELASEDTYFSPNPDTGFILPESVHIVQPGVNIPDGQLFIIDGNVTRYKNDNFSESEIKTILSLLDESTRDEYLHWESGELKDYELEIEMYKWDARTKKMYETAKDKKAFLRGMFEEERYQILSKFVRDIAVQQTMQDMGYTKVSGHEDLSTRAVADAAFKMGVFGNSGDKGHSNSLYAEIEGVYVLFHHYMDAIKNINDIDSLVAYFDDDDKTNTKMAILRAIVSQDTINFDDRCNHSFLHIQDYYKYILPNVSDTDSRKVLEHYINAKTIADVDKNLATTISRWISKMQSEFNTLENKIYQMPGYAKSVDKLKSLIPDKTSQFNRGIDRN